VLEIIEGSEVDFLSAIEEYCPCNSFRKSLALLSLDVYSMDKSV